MKKLLTLALAAVLALALAACSGGTSGPQAQEETPASPEPEYLSPGDTVSTDILTFTLDEAQLAVALDSTLNENYAEPKEYDPQTDAQNPFVAATGHTYAAFVQAQMDRSVPPAVLLSATLLLQSLGAIFESRAPQEPVPGGLRIDRKRLQKLRELREARGLRGTGFDEGPYLGGMTMGW